MHKLHRSWSGWEISNTGIILTRENDGWRIGWTEDARNLRAWVYKQGLTKPFPSRASAYRAAVAALNIEPLDSVSSPTIALIPDGVDRWQTREADYTVTRAMTVNSAGKDRLYCFVYDERTGQYVGGDVTLRKAKRCIAARRAHAKR